MSEMIERAARAIAVAHGTDPDQEGPGQRHAVPMEDGTTAIITDHFGPLWKMWVPDARAAILAALDPSDDSVRDVCAAVLRDKGPVDLTVVEAQRCVTVVINALRSLAAQGEPDGAKT